jgi:hypothetical protein
MSSIYEWTERACALPGAPDIWLLAADGKGLITVDGDEGLYGIASDGTWWEPTGRADRPWVLAVDHDGTAGCLLALLGQRCLVRILPREGLPIEIVIPSGLMPDGRPHRVTGINLGRACIAAAAAIGRWPGGGG